MNLSQGKRDIEYVIRENKILKEENEILREQVLGIYLLLNTKNKFYLRFYYKN